MASPLLALMPTGGCAEKQSTKANSIELAPATDLGPTIGSFAEVSRPEPVAVEGYGLVGGLPGTGSAYCPPHVRAYLKQYILVQLPHERVSVDELIDSKNTAVVRLEGWVPAAASKDEHFDVRATLIPGSEATSIRSGWLYKAELVARGTFGVDTRPLATVDGSIFINPIGPAQSDAKSGYILGGGRATYDYVIVLRLRRPDFRVASVIRNRLSERYGPNIAKALSPSDIEVRIPLEYRRRKQRFIAMVPATFLEVTPELAPARVNTLIHQLAVSDHKESAEIALEAIGRDSLGKLPVLLDASDAEVRFRAARCMLNLGDDRALPTLRTFATDKGSPYRLDALDAIMVSARRNDALALAQRLLRDRDVAVVLAAYEHLRQMDAPAVTREIVGRSFLLEQVVQTDWRAIFVSRCGDPRIALFGAPLACHDNVFVESPGGMVVIDSRAGQDYISVIRKHPTRPGVIGPVKSSPGLADLIRTLATEPAPMAQGQLRGLGVCYAEVIALLEQMSAKGAVAAEFWVGPLPKIDVPVKKQRPSGR